MSWYKISYACGHVGREQIYGKCSERDREAERRGNNRVCPDCYIASRREADRRAARQRVGLSAPVVPPPPAESTIN